MAGDELTALVFTTVPGLVLAIDRWGFATNDSGARVPDAVADDLERQGRADLRIMRPSPSPDTPNDTPRSRGRQRATAAPEVE